MSANARRTSKRRQPASGSGATDEPPRSGAQDGGSPSGSERVDREPTAPREPGVANAMDAMQGVQGVLEFWQQLIPQLLARVSSARGAAMQTPPSMPMLDVLKFPADQLVKAAQVTQQSVQALMQAAMPLAGDTARPGTYTSWLSALPFTSTAAVQSMGQMWSDYARRIGLPMTAEAQTAFDRTFGALSDALGLGPARQLAAGWQELLGAAMRQQEARASYALVVNAAFASGYESLVQRLADKASAGERVDSVFALLRLWAIATENAVHETLQSERGLAATAALTRASLAYQKASQKVADTLAGMLDIATRRDLDDAFREIQALKRELRHLRDGAKESTP